MTLEWLKAAYLDIENMKYIVEVEHLSSIVAFHSQQAIEKSFKAIIVNDDMRIPKQHDLLKLYNLINENNKISINDLNILDTLNQLYIDSRYPGSFGLLPNGKPTLKDAKEFYEFALDIFNRVCILLEIDQEKVKY